MERKVGEIVGRMLWSEALQKRFLYQAAWCDNLLLSFIGKRKKDAMRRQGLAKGLAECSGLQSESQYPEAGH